MFILERAKPERALKVKWIFQGSKTSGGSSYREGSSQQTRAATVWYTQKSELPQKMMSFIYHFFFYLLVI